MRYFVSGGAGFIGIHFVETILARGDEVTIYDNFSNGRREFLTPLAGNPRLRVCEADVGDLEKVSAAMAGHDHVIHLACNSDIALSEKVTDLDLRNGTILTFNVLEAMRRNGVKQLWYASGSGVYGEVDSKPVAEDFGPLLPISMYGASKLACEGMISAFCHMYEMRACMFRFANVVGDRQTHGVAYDFIRRLRKDPAKLTIFGDGAQSKSYIHVSDVIAAVSAAHERAPGRVNLYNVGSDDFIDVTAIANLVCREMGLKNVELAYTGGKRGWKGDVPVIRLNLDRIHGLNWKAVHNSAEAITASIRSMLQEV